MSKTKISNEAYIKESNLILSNKGKTFFWAKFLLKKEHATKAVRLYRFCRYIDDVGDENVDRALAEKMLKQIIEEITLGISNHPVISDAIALFTESNIDINIPISLIHGVMSDSNLVRIKDEEALMVYAYQVAGTVGLMMSKILDVKDPRAFSHAIDLGIAMQITNICRDTTEDALMDRRYLPASFIGNIEPGLLISPDKITQDKIRKALAKMLNTADQYYQSGYQGLCFLPIRARLGIAIASGLYRQIGTNLIKKNYASWLFRSVVSKKMKAWLTIKILMRSLVDPLFYFSVKPHNSKLHHSIKEIAYSHV